MSDDFLPYFITEDLYLIKETVQVEKSSPSASATTPQAETDVREVAEAPQLIAPKEHYDIIVVTGAINEQDKVLLTKVLEAVAINITDAKLIAEAPNPTVSFAKMLVFNEGPSQLYTPSKTEQGEVLYSKPLSALHASREDKLQLWNALKSWFAIS